MDTLNELLNATGEFTPYCFLSEDADALTVYFRGDADYSKRLTAHLTLYLSVDTDEIVGCRIKGFSWLRKSIPNFIRANHGGCDLSLMFLPFLGQDDESVRKYVEELGKTAKEHNLTLDDCPA